ncbi:MAG: ferrochelatase [bacterium]|nr:ferrochelatase [bacterium]
MLTAKNSNFGCRPQPDKIGILLAQLGTPDAPTTGALRTYLREFLSDPRVIEANRILWWFILNFIVLVTRPARSAKLYKRMWTEKGSPLLTITEDQATKLRKRFDNNSVKIEIGMRYGNPSLKNAVKNLIDSGCEKIILVPLYPQYAAATTASVYDIVFPTLLKERFVPTIRCVEPFFKHPGYIKAVADKISTYLKITNNKAEKILLSYHSIPQRYVRAGDPYCCSCVATTKLLVKELGLSEDKYLHTFQSRFNKEPWLQPFTDQTAINLIKDGVTHVAVVCPGFTADCLETIDEIGHELKEQFHENGGAALDLIPCVNDSELFINCLEDLIRDAGGKWFENATQEQNLCSSCPSKLDRAANE